MDDQLPKKMVQQKVIAKRFLFKGEKAIQSSTEGGKMAILPEKESQQILELLQHCGEFIAYFELADEKMLAWREEIMQHQQEIVQGLDQIVKEIKLFNQIISETNLRIFCLQASETLQLGKEHVEALKTMQSQVSEHWERQQIVLQQQLQEHTQVRLGQLDEQLKAYDPQQFHRIANESCQQIEHVAQTILRRSQATFRQFNGRVVCLSLVSAFLTAMMLGLYMNNELPWESHQLAKTEREAGQILLKAWPALSRQEQARIISLSSTVKAQ